MVSNLGIKVTYLLEAVCSKLKFKLALKKLIQKLTQVLRQYKINASPNLDSQLQADILSFVNSASLAELVSIGEAPEERTTITFGTELLSNLNPESDKLEVVNLNGVLVRFILN